MAANQTLDDIPEDEHPALLLARAHELATEAEQLAAQAKERRMEAARLRAKAERLRDGAHLAPKRTKPEPIDPLTAAAGLAVEELRGTWQLEELAGELELRDMKRVAKIVSALQTMDVVVRVEGGWRTVDPEEARVRDGLRELGTCSRDQLAEHLGVPPAALTYYMELGQERGWLDVAHDGHLMYLKPGPERIVTRRPHRRPPEQDPPAYLDAVKRGEPVRVVHHGKRGGAMSNPGQRHLLKLRDQRREAMENAKAARAEKQRARDEQRNAAGGRKK